MGNVIGNLSTVDKRFPPGTVVRSKRDGHRYMIGVKYGRSDYWLMPLEAQTGKTTVPAYRIISDFEVVEA